MKNGLKIKTPISTDKGVISDVEIKFSEFYMNKDLNINFSVRTNNNDNEPVETFSIKPIYNFQLESIPTLDDVWILLKTLLLEQGLEVEEL